MPLACRSGLSHSTSLFFRRPSRVLLFSRGPDPLRGGEQIPCGSWSRHLLRIPLRPALLESASQFDANLFIGHPDAGWRSAVIYSLIVSCRRRGINPQDYLSDVLRRLPSMDITRIDELLPERWKPPASAPV